MLDVVKQSLGFYETECEGQGGGVVIGVASRKYLQRGSVQVRESRLPEERERPPFYSHTLARDFVCSNSKRLRFDTLIAFK